MKETQLSSKYTAKTFISDLSAGVVVFLVALPLCLGVAVASQAPNVESNVTPFAGLLAGIIGGLVIGFISKSGSSVSGPAAGLTAVVAGLVATLGSFELFLISLFVGGIIQFFLGVFKLGSIADFVPVSVIKGLLAAIGLILILKQLPHLVGHDKNLFGEMSFFQPDGQTTFSELWLTLSDFHYGAGVVGMISLLVLVMWDRVTFLKKSLVPGALIVVFGGVMGGVLLAGVGGAWVIGLDHRVSVPVAGSLQEFVGFVKFPDLSLLLDIQLIPAILFGAITICAVASLETLLNLEAVDKIDPQKRVSPPNRELVAQGIGNTLGGLVGAIPMTSVIVRSSVNINAGGKTKVATIVHGTLLLVCVAFAASWLNMIPLSCLAAVLIITGFKLASPKIFKEMWHAGMSQFLPFVVTILAILFTDLLQGILIGLAVSILFILRANLRRPIRRFYEHHIGDDVTRIELANQVSFLNRAALTKVLNDIPRDGHVCIDATQTDYIDSDVLALIMEYERETAPARGVKVSLLGLKDHYKQLEDRVQYVDHATREVSSRLTADQVQKVLEKGNERYRTGRPLKRDIGKQRRCVLNGQYPIAVVLSGAGGRNPVESIFDVGVGDIACVRTTGNCVAPGVLGSLEYGTAVLGAQLIVVLGHTRNNATRMAIEHMLGIQPDINDLENLVPILKQIQESIDPTRVQQFPEMSEDQQREFVDEVSRNHVQNMVKRIQDESYVIGRLVDQGMLRVTGAIYNLETGKVEFLERRALDARPTEIAHPDYSGETVQGAGSS